MKDIKDPGTIEMLPTPKKRGRPSTGKAKTAAERKQDQRQRDIKKQLKEQEMTTSGLLENLPALIREGHIHLLENHFKELMRRCKANRSD
jgi:hypothetical protein